MPRLPTILVIGSQDMSTTLPASGVTRSLVAIADLLVPPPGLVARGELAVVVAPLGLLVHRPVGDRAELADRSAIDGDRVRGDPAAGRRVHERHELVREAGHRAADADAADVRAAADAGHPPALGHVAVDHRAPAPDLHQALGRVVVLGEV